MDHSKKILKEGTCNFKTVASLGSTVCIAGCYRRRTQSEVCVSVSVQGTPVSPAKTAGPITVPFGRQTRAGPRNRVLDGCTLTPPGEYD